jgi:hypothetical protein
MAPPEQAVEQMQVHYHNVRRIGSRGLKSPL